MLRCQSIGWSSWRKGSGCAAQLTFVAIRKLDWRIECQTYIRSLLPSKLGDLTVFSDSVASGLLNDDVSLFRPNLLSWWSSCAHLNSNENWTRLAKSLAAHWGSNLSEGEHVELARRQSFKLYRKGWCFGYNWWRWRRFGGLLIR